MVSKPSTSSSSWRRALISDLIYDIGMYNAADTEFYLKKGFRVIAIEANPKLCKDAETTYASYIESGQLTILERGLFSTSGLHKFMINLDQTDRSSFDPAWCPDDNRTVIEVACVTLDEVLDQFGTPYYMKIDIEQLDHLCIEALERRTDLPRFVSIETDHIGFVQKMSTLGYKRFKIISQIWNQAIPLPFPALEGLYVEQRFTRSHSGPFGAETYGTWLSKDEALDEIAKIRSKDYGASRHKLFGCPEEAFFYNWYDAHASLD